MLAYDEFETFRTPKRAPHLRSLSKGPERIAALDDLHRTLYGSLHPSAEIIESDRELVEGDGEGGERAEDSGSSWLEQNALTAAVAVLGVAALYAWMQRGKTPPLKGPADVLPAPSHPQPPQGSGL